MFLFLEWIDVVTWFECVSRHVKCPWISGSVHKGRMIRRWPENVPKMSRNRGNVIDLLTGKISATTPPTESDPVSEITEKILLLPPPPHWIRSGNRDHGKFLLLPHWLRSAPRRGDENVPGGPPPKKILATPLRQTTETRSRIGQTPNYSECLVRTHPSLTGPGMAILCIKCN